MLNVLGVLLNYVSLTPYISYGKTGLQVPSHFYVKRRLRYVELMLKFGFLPHNKSVENTFCEKFQPDCEFCYSA